MKIGVLGTGTVGNTIGNKLISLGHHVMMGSRSSGNQKSSEFVSAAGANASSGTFAETAVFGEIIFNCTKGESSIGALKMAGAETMKGKILIDVTNPLDFSKGFPPTLIWCNSDSLGEMIQRTFPEVRVVKALNTMNCNLMVNPATLAGKHDVFMCGNDADAKNTVKDILMNWFGWERVIDLGDISNARGTEMILPLWVRLYAGYGHANFNFHVNS